MGFLKDNRFQITGGILVIILFFYLRSTLEVNENFHESMLEMEKDGEYSGKVLGKDIDVSDHNTPKLKLSNTSISINNDFYDKIYVGDSIIKKSGEYFLTVYKKDGSTIKLDYKKYFDKLSGKYIEQENIYPVQNALVNDYENLFSKDQIDKLDTLLLKFDSLNKNKIVLLTVKSYNESMNFQDYVSDLAKRWHIDQNNEGRVILIVFSKEKRKIAFSFGDGVKNFTEIQANEIISQKVLPQFKKNEYYSGIETCILEIIHEWQ